MISRYEYISLTGAEMAYKEEVRKRMSLPTKVGKNRTAFTQLKQIASKETNTGLKEGIITTIAKRVDPLI